MAIGQYWVGQIPLRNLSLTVKDSGGNVLDCTAYTDVSVRILGPHNEEITTTGSSLDRGGDFVGKFTFNWPRDRSMFLRAGDYVLQVILASTSAGVKDMTTSYTMRVRALGKAVKSQDVYNNRWSQGSYGV